MIIMIKQKEFIDNIFINKSFALDYVEYLDYNHYHYKNKTLPCVNNFYEV